MKKNSLQDVFPTATGTDTKFHWLKIIELSRFNMVQTEMKPLEYFSITTV